MRDPCTTDEAVPHPPRLRLGFILSHVGARQDAYELLSSAGDFLEARRDADVVVFTQHIMKPWRVPPTAVMNATESFDFRGIVVATNLFGASNLLGSPGATRRIFYVQDFEWGQQDGPSFEDCEAIYRDPRLELVARSTEHGEVLRGVWNRPVLGVVESFNVEAFARLLEV